MHRWNDALSQCSWARNMSPNALCTPVVLVLDLVRRARAPDRLSSRALGPRAFLRPPPGLLLPQLRSFLVQGPREGGVVVPPAIPIGTRGKNAGLLCAPRCNTICAFRRATAVFPRHPWSRGTCTGAFMLPRPSIGSSRARPQLAGMCCVDMRGKDTEGIEECSPVGCRT